MLVSIGLPVRNAADRLEATVRSVLEQKHELLEVIISDNASTDGTEDICRELAKADPRVVYIRQPRDLGLLGNFAEVLNRSTGTFFRWMGDDDWLAPECVSRSLEVFAADERLILVTTGVTYTGPDGTTMRPPVYERAALRSDDPVDRFAEMMRVQTQSHMLLDPLYGIMRRTAVAALRRPYMLREDEVFAVMLALAGPWGHVPDVLAHRSLSYRRLPQVARVLGVPSWTTHFATTLQFRAILRHLREADLTADQRRRARAATARMYAVRQRQTMTHRGRKLMKLARNSVRAAQ